jgi:hypothetical protein
MRREDRLGKRDERKREGGVEESKQRAVTNWVKGVKFGGNSTWAVTCTTSEHLTGLYK